jgi:hypothetical protein
MNVQDISDPSAFITEVASLQNGMNLFDWTCKVPMEGLKTGSYPVFEKKDKRPNFVINEFGSVKGWDILELGSFEGGHAYQLEKSGASVVGIEAHPSNYIKCLLAKNALQMNSVFLLGDFQKYLAMHSKKYDLIFASGVLYHMLHPVELMFHISNCTDRAFFWTHYVNSNQANEWNSKFKEECHYKDFACTYYKYAYDTNRFDRIYAGVEKECSRMTKDDIVNCLRHFGLTKFILLEDEPDHPGGPAFSFIVHR